MSNDINEILKSELSLMGFSKIGLTVENIRSKDGVHVYRVFTDKQSYVIKYFSNISFRREIQNYQILKSNGIPTIDVTAYTEQSILLEDICSSDIYRLGKAQDLEDENCVRLIAKWYKSLHANGEKAMKLASLYSESDIIQKDSVTMVKEKSNTQSDPVWNLILDNLDTFRRIISQCSQTLTYNDFFWTNLIVEKNMTEAMMFDFNLLGRGYRYSDIRNICSSLSQRCKTAFLEEYGDFDSREKIIDDGISILINLVFAFEKKNFPEWGKESLKKLKSGDFHERMKRILKF